jgi:hypothetical protein
LLDRLGHDMYLVRRRMVSSPVTAITVSAMHVTARVARPANSTWPTPAMTAPKETITARTARTTVTASEATV